MVPITVPPPYKLEPPLRSPVTPAEFEPKSGPMSDLTFANYLEQRRSTYTQEWELLQELKQHPAFRSAVSSEDIETYLNDRNAPWGVREAARAAWTGYQAAKRKRLLAYHPKSLPVQLIAAALPSASSSRNLTRRPP